MPYAHVATNTGQNYFLNGGYVVVATPWSPEVVYVDTHCVGVGLAPVNALTNDGVMPPSRTDLKGKGWHGGTARHLQASRADARFRGR